MLPTSRQNLAVEARIGDMLPSQFPKRREGEALFSCFQVLKGSLGWQEPKGGRGRDGGLGKGLFSPWPAVLPVQVGPFTKAPEVPIWQSPQGGGDLHGDKGPKGIGCMPEEEDGFTTGEVQKREPLPARQMNPYPRHPLGLLGLPSSSRHCLQAFPA